MIAVFLRGDLAQFGEEWQLDCRNSAEVIRAIGCQRPDFLAFLAESDCDYQVAIDGESIDADGLYNPCIATCEILPILAGSSVFEKILLGGALLLGGAFFPAALTAFGTNIATTLGAALVWGGIANIISPPAANPKKSEPSAIFGAATLNSTEGSTIPVVFGTDVWIELTSLISGEISNNDIAVDFVP